MTSEAPEVKQVKIEPSEPYGWPPPMLPLQMLEPAPAPEELQVTHLQRKRAVASLGEKLAILLPDARSEVKITGQVLLVPPVETHASMAHSVVAHSRVARSPLAREPEPAIKLVPAPTMPAKVQSLSVGTS